MTFDVFPRRNLPDGAEQWGRAHDDRVLGLERDVQSLGQSLSGQNRNTASSLASLADQIRTLEGYNPEASTIPTSQGVATSGASTPNWEVEAFNASLDPELNITSTTGRLLITISSPLGIYGGGDYYNFMMQVALLLQVDNEDIPGWGFFSETSEMIFNQGTYLTRSENADPRVGVFSSSNLVTRVLEISVPTGVVNLRLRRLHVVAKDGPGVVGSNPTPVVTYGPRTLMVQQLPPLPES